MGGTQCHGPHLLSPKISIAWKPGFEPKYPDTEFRGVYVCVFWRFIVYLKELQRDLKYSDMEFRCVCVCLFFEDLYFYLKELQRDLPFVFQSPCGCTGWARPGQSQESRVSSWVSCVDGKGPCIWVSLHSLFSRPLAGSWTRSTAAGMLEPGHIGDVGTTGRGCSHYITMPAPRIQVLNQHLNLWAKHLPCSRLLGSGTRIHNQIVFVDWKLNILKLTEHNAGQN